MSIPVPPDIPGMMLKLQQWAQAYQKNGICDVCGMALWSMIPVPLVVNQFFPGAGMVIGAGVTQVPVMFIVCNNCGYIRMVAAMKMDTVPQPAVPQGQPGQPIHIDLTGLDKEAKPKEAQK